MASAIDRPQACRPAVASRVKRIVVVDYGMGNLRSVAKALEHVAPDHTVLVSHKASDILASERLVLPGQGAMPDCMRMLRSSGLADGLLRAAESKPLLGVCVGEQMLFEFSEEGPSQGLGLLPGDVCRFPDQNRLKVPHMGWNRVWPESAAQPHPLWEGIPPGAYFYFVHSYFARPREPGHRAASTEYGVRFSCAVSRHNLFATQFHPEKSAADGLRLYRNFVSWDP